MELVGQAVGFQDVEIRARVEGFLETVAFTEGSLVRKGQLLYKIDPKPLQAVLASAKANLATSQARLEKSINDVKRLTPLAAQQAVSQQELDNAASQRDAARRAGGRQQGGGGEGRVRPQLHDDYRAARRPDRHDEGEGRQPGRARRKHAARDDFADRPDPLPRRHRRGRVPQGGQARRGAAGAGGRPGRADAHPADPGRRHRAPARGPPRRRRAQRRHDHRHDRAADQVREPRAPRAARASSAA